MNVFGGKVNTIVWFCFTCDRVHYAMCIECARRWPIQCSSLHSVQQLNAIHANHRVWCLGKRNIGLHAENRFEAFWAQLRRIYFTLWTCVCFFGTNGFMLRINIYTILYIYIHSVGSFYFYIFFVLHTWFTFIRRSVCAFWTSKCCIYHWAPMDATQIFVCLAPARSQYVCDAQYKYAYT